MIYYFMHDNTLCWLASAKQLSFLNMTFNKCKRVIGPHNWSYVKDTFYCVSFSFSFTLDITIKIDQTQFLCNIFAQNYRMQNFILY